MTLIDSSRCGKTNLSAFTNHLAISSLCTYTFYFDRRVPSHHLSKIHIFIFVRFTSLWDVMILPFSENYLFTVQNFFCFTKDINGNPLENNPLHLQREGCFLFQTKQPGLIPASPLPFLPSNHGKRVSLHSFLLACRLFWERRENEDNTPIKLGGTAALVSIIPQHFVWSISVLSTLCSHQLSSVARTQLRAHFTFFSSVSAPVTLYSKHSFRQT